MIATAGVEQYQGALAVLHDCGEVDAVIVIYIPVGLAAADMFGRTVLEVVEKARASAGAGKPVFCCLMSEDSGRRQFVGTHERIPSFAFPEAPARVLSKAAAYALWKAAPDGRLLDFDGMNLAVAQGLLRHALQHGGGWLPAEDTRQVLLAAGVPVLAGGVAKTADEAVALARQIGFPVAVKLASRRLVHKTEIGAIFLDRPDERSVSRAYAEIRERLEKENQLDAMDGVLVQPMVRGGVEVMVGATDDRLFGPLIAFGLGGIHMEILGDVCFRVAPLTDLDASEMVRSIRGFRLLEGYRGHAPADVEAIEEVLLRVSRLMEGVPEIRELDLNPMIALEPGRGCQIVDARIHVQTLDPGRQPGD
jgi:acyl-CoA synthetase (NDP forming)